MEEIWRDVENYEGLYQISNLGRVKSMARLSKNGKTTYKHLSEKIKKIQVNEARYGYCEISLYKDNHEKRFRINRIVALAFIPNPKNLPEVNHKDGIKLNNCVDNLEWMTSSENKQHGWENNLYSSEHKKKSIKCIETNEIFDSVVGCSIKLNIDRRSIFRVLKGDRKSCNKLTFEYV